MELKKFENWEETNEEFNPAALDDFNKIYKKTLKKFKIKKLAELKDEDKDKALKYMDKLGTKAVKKNEKLPKGDTMG